MSAVKTRCTYHDRAVLGAAGDDMVIVRAPVDVQDRSRMTTYCWVGLVYATRLKQREDEEGSAPTGLDDDGDKFGVDGTEGAVPCDPGDADVVIALVVLHCLAKDMTELTRSHHSPEHIS